MSSIVEHSVRIGKPVMAVSINYRLAGYGFLYSDEIVKAGLANLGLRDQRLALTHYNRNGMRLTDNGPDSLSTGFRRTLLALGVIPVMLPSGERARTDSHDSLQK